jgi:hypothetical protein
VVGLEHGGHEGDDRLDHDEDPFRS